MAHSRRRSHFPARWRHGGVRHPTRVDRPTSPRSPASPAEWALFARGWLRRPRTRIAVALGTCAGHAELTRRW